MRPDSWVDEGPGRYVVARCYWCAAEVEVLLGDQDFEALPHPHGIVAVGKRTCSSTRVRFYRVRIRGGKKTFEDPRAPLVVRPPGPLDGPDLGPSRRADGGRS